MLGYALGLLGARTYLAVHQLERQHMASKAMLDAALIEFERTQREHVERTLCTHCGHTTTFVNGDCKRCGTPEEEKHER